MRKTGLVMLWVAALAILAVTVCHIVVSVSDRSGLTHVSGSWITLAMDYADGVFYRPLWGPDGYGGTRFMPLHFVIHGLLIMLGIPAVTAGYVITAVAAAGLLCGIYALLRRVGVELALAVPLAVFVLCSSSVQQAVTTIRGDLLPAALNVWGLALCVSVPGAPIRRPALCAAAGFFVLAFAAKLTALYAPIAVCLALVLQGSRRESLLLGALTASGAAAACAIIYLASGGRAAESIMACWSGGGDWTGLLMAPLVMLEYPLLRRDPIAMFLLLLAGAAFLTVARRHWRETPSVVLVVTGIAVCATFASPGTDYNHLIDLVVITVVFLGVRLGRRRLPASLGAATVFLSALFASVVVWSDVRHHSPVSADRQRGSVLAEFNRDGLVLSQNPLLPAMAGQRAYMLDPFAFRVVRGKRPDIAADLWRALSERRFVAVITQGDVTAADIRAHMDMTHIGPGFVEKLLENYRPAARYDEPYGSFVVYLPVEGSGLDGVPARQP